MAGNKETPRQKMIGMMYLVLTALLALNVQKEVLMAFVELDEGMTQSSTIGSDKNKGLYADFKFAYNLDPAKTEVYWNDAQQIQKQVQLVNTYLDSVRTVIIAETEGIPKEEADTISLEYVEKLENYDESTRIMVGNKENGSNGEARKIRNALLNLEEDINEVMQAHGLEKLDSPVDFSDRTREGETHPWEVHTFYDTPLAGAVALISKMKTDVQQLEFEAVSRLLSRIDVEDIPIDTVLAKVIPKSNYVLLGEDYESDIFLGAYSTTSTPQVFLGELNPEKTAIVGEAIEVEVDAGSGKILFPTQQEGWHDYSGLISIRDKQGREKTYPFESGYLVAKPSAVVSPTKMNVLYKGIENPISVSVPGIPDEKIRVRMDAGQIRRVGQDFEAIVNNQAPQQVYVHVSAEMENGEFRDMGKMVFRTKRIPNPQARIGQITSMGVMTKSQFLAMPGIIAEYGQDFPFDLTAQVVSFKAEVITASGVGQTRTNQGARFNSELINRFQNVRPGNRVMFYDIMIKGEDGTTRKVNSITIKIGNG